MIPSMPQTTTHLNSICPNTIAASIPRPFAIPPAAITGILFALLPSELT
jgi:hypothetical protein